MKDALCFRSKSLSSSESPAPLFVLKCRGYTVRENTSQSCTSMDVPSWLHPNIPLLSWSSSVFKSCPGNLLVLKVPAVNTLVKGLPHKSPEVKLVLDYRPRFLATVFSDWLSPSNEAATDARRPSLVVEVIPRYGSWNFSGPCGVKLFCSGGRLLPGKSIGLRDCTCGNKLLILSTSTCTWSWRRRIQHLRESRARRQSFELLLLP